MTTCKHCSGNHGHIINGSHILCNELSKLGQPTPCLGMTCDSCGGSGTQSTSDGAAVFLDAGPAAVAKAINAAFPPCPDCGGRGYTLR